MDPQILELPHPRSSHSAGHCEVLYLRSMEAAVTGGYDGSLNLFSLEPEKLMDDSKQLEAKQQGPICCLVQSNSKYFASLSEDSTVALYSATNSQFVKYLTRSSSVLTCASFNPDETIVVLGGEDGMLRFIDIDDVKNVTLVPAGQAGSTVGVHSIAWDPKNEWVACSLDNGNICIYKVENDETFKLAQQLSGVTTKSPHPHKLCWNPQGTLLAFPGLKNDVIWISRDSWQVYATLVSANPSFKHIGSITICAFSPGSGALFATAGIDSRVLIWSAASRQVVCSTGTNSSSITGISWASFGSGDLLLANSNGQFYYCDGAVDGLDDDLAIDDNANFVIDDDGAGYAEPVTGKTSREGERKDHKSSRLHDVIEKWSKRANNDTNDGATTQLQSNMVSDELDSSIPYTGGLRMKLQEPFQSGATPVEGHRQYLAFNMVGIVNCVRHDDHSTVSIELHDQSKHRPFQISDHYDFSLAYIYESGVALASKGTAEIPSTIFYRPYATWSGKGQWMHSLGPSESATCIAVTSLGVVVATDKQYLRFFSFSGVQTFIMSLPGPPVSMATCKDLLAIAYHAGAPFDALQTPNLGFVLYRVSDLHVVQQGALCLSPGARLTWLQFAEESSMLCSFDTGGVLRALFLACNNTWIPILESRTRLQNPSHESVWPVGVSEEAKLVCVILRGGAQYPRFPKPILSELELQLPLLDVDSAQGELEESLVRSNLLFTQATYRVPGVKSGAADKTDSIKRQRIDMEKTIIKLIQMACQQEDNLRAYDLATFLQTQKAIEGAVQIARVKRLDRLAERIYVLSEKLHSRNDVAEPSSKKARLSSSINENNEPQAL